MKFLDLTGLSDFLSNLRNTFAPKTHKHIKSDITDFPTIPSKTSQLVNDSGYKTTDNNTTYTLSKSGSTITLTGSDGKTTSVADSNTTYGGAGVNLGLVKTGGDVSISSGVITVNDDSHNHIIGNVDGLQSALDGKASSLHTHTASQITQDVAHRFVTDADKTNWNGTYKKATGYTDTAISNLINGAPTTLDTLKEIADAMAKNQTVVEALNTSIGTKANQSDLTTHTGNANIHMTASEKSKLSGIATGANKYVHPTTAGNKHIPAGGVAGQVLKWSADGTAKWDTDINTNTTYTFTNGNDGSFTVKPSGGVAQKVTIGKVANASVAESLDLGYAETYGGGFGDVNRPVFFDIVGFPIPINYTIESNVPPNAKFTDTTYGGAGVNLGLVKTGGDVSIANGIITVNDDSHNHSIHNISKLGDMLNGKIGKNKYSLRDFKPKILTSNQYCSVKECSDFFGQKCWHIEAGLFPSAGSGDIEISLGTCESLATGGRFISLYCMINGQPLDYHIQNSQIEFYQRGLQSGSYACPLSYGEKVGNFHRIGALLKEAINYEIVLSIKAHDGDEIVLGGIKLEDNLSPTPYIPAIQDMSTTKKYNVLSPSFQVDSTRSYTWVIDISEYNLTGLPIVQIYNKKTNSIVSTNIKVNDISIEVRFSGLSGSYENGYYEAIIIG